MLFGHFHHPPDPDSPLTRTVISAPGQSWGVVSDLDVDDRPCGGDFVEESGQRRLVAVYSRGDTYLHQGKTRTELGRPPHVGFLSGVKRVGEHLYACGSQHAVYRLEGGAWAEVAGTPRRPYEGPQDPILHAIDGFGLEDLYVVGNAGAIQYFDGASWHDLEIPAPVALQQVLCHEDGSVYACGSSGTVLRGGLDGWQRLEAAGLEDDFWGLASFGGTVYACTHRSLYAVSGRTLVEVPVAVNRARRFYRLASNQAFLWATTGTGSVLRFDGREWSEITWPDSV